jgi:hypothetical protein
MSPMIYIYNQDERSHHIPCGMISFNVSEVGNVLFKMADVAIAVIGRTIVGRRSIGLIGLKFIDFVTRQSWIPHTLLTTSLTRQICELHTLELHC